MRTIVEFISTIAPFIYVLAAVGIFFALRGIYVSRRSRRVAAFGLEREAAEQRLRRSVNTVVTLVLVSVTVYVISNIIQPNLPNETTQALETPTPTPAEGAETAGTPTPPPLLYPTPTNIPGFPEADAGERALAESDLGICEFPQVTINSPEPDTTLTGQVNIRGEANVFPFYQYKLEVRSAQTNDQWIVVNTGDEATPEGFLGTWDTTSFPQGDYTLRLLVYRSVDQAVPPCEINVTVAAP
jgi:hypothetical protein